MLQQSQPTYFLNASSSTKVFQALIEKLILGGPEFYDLCIFNGTLRLTNSPLRNTASGAQMT